MRLMAYLPPPSGLADLLRNAQTRIVAQHPEAIAYALLHAPLVEGIMHDDDVASFVEGIRELRLRTADSQTDGLSLLSNGTVVVRIRKTEEFVALRQSLADAFFCYESDQSPGRHAPAGPEYPPSFNVCERFPGDFEKAEETIGRLPMYIWRPTAFALARKENGVWEHLAAFPLHNSLGSPLSKY